ncbi:MAG TPA: hypothetical protein VHH90_08715 [Polyangia bacterium]|nr:hypothetical protein [Polyangia bacterium]
MLLIDSVWAAFIWPPLGAVMGLFLCLASETRSIPTVASYMALGALGASAGGVVTYVFTYDRALLGGFWTSIVTSMLGGLIFLGLWKAWLDASRAPPLRPSARVSQRK